MAGLSLGPILLT